MKKFFLLLAILTTSLSFAQRGGEMILASNAQYQAGQGGGSDPILTGLLGAWEFETINPVDLIGSVNGTAQSGPTLVTGPTGSANAVNVSSADNSWIDFGDPITLEQLDAVTVIIDFYPTLAGETGTSNIFGNFWSQSGNHIWHLGWNASQNVRGRIHDASTNYDIISTGGPYALNTWHRAAIRWEGQGYPVKIWVDGTEFVGGTNVVGTMRDAAEGIAVSMNTAFSGASARQFTGRVDNAFIWGRYLSDAEMTQMFTNNPTYDDLAGSGDADANAFIAEVESAGTPLSTTEEDAIQSLVTGLKSNNLWDKAVAIYPYIGGSAISQRYNLKNPANTDAAFRLEAFAEGTGQSINNDAGWWIHSPDDVGNGAYLTTHIDGLDLWPGAVEDDDMDFGIFHYQLINVPDTRRQRFFSGWWTGVGAGAVQFDAYNASGELSMRMGSKNVLTAASSIPGYDAKGFVGGYTNGSTVNTWWEGSNRGSLAFAATDVQFDATNIRVMNIAGNSTSSTATSAASFADGSASYSRYTFSLISNTDWSDAEVALLEGVVDSYVAAIGRTAEAAEANAFAATLDADGNPLSPSEETALATLISSLKANGTWEKYDAIYPYIGASAATHKYNLKAPADTDHDYRLTYSGTVTHNALGGYGDGSTGYANTHYVYSLNDSRGTDSHIQVYVNSNNTPVQTDVLDMGTYHHTDPSGILIGTRRTGLNPNELNLMHGQNRYYVQADVTNDARKHLLITKGGANAETYVDGVLYDTRATTAISNTSNNPIFLHGNSNGAQAPYVAGSSNQSIAFAAIGQHLTESEVAADYADIQVFQETLEREVVPNNVVPDGHAASIGAGDTNATTGWVNGNGTTFAAVTRGTEYAMELTGISAGYVRGEYSVTVENATSYTVTYDYRVTNYVGGTPRADAWTGTTEVGDWPTKIFETDGTWRTASHTLTTSGTTLLMRFYEDYSDGGNGNVIEIDNLRVVKTNTDADAQAYIDAVISEGGSLTGAQQTSIDTFVKDMKSNSLWDKVMAIYPFMGGTANSHRLNLKDPRTVQDAHMIEYLQGGTGSFTHDAAGTTTNTTDDNNGAWMAPNIQPSDWQPTNNSDFEFNVAIYQTMDLTGVTRRKFSVSTWPGTELARTNMFLGVDDRYGFFSTGGSFYPSYTTTFPNDGSNAGCQGFYMVASEANGDSTLWKNGVEVVSFTPTTGRQTYQTNDQHLAIGSTGAGSDDVFSYTETYNPDVGTATYAYVSIGGSLPGGAAEFTQAEATTYNTIVEAFMDAIGRGVQN